MTAHTKNESVFAIGRAGTVGYAPGLTKRELFAAMAMQGMNSNPELSQNKKQIAKWAVLQADALLDALSDDLSVAQSEGK